MKRLALIATVLALTACTPEQIARWEQVNGLEPGAAKAAGDAVLAAEQAVPVQASPPVAFTDPVGDAIRRSFPNEVAKAHAIARCESKLNPRAVSHTNDHGLFQINEPTWNRPGHSDPVARWIGAHWSQVYDPYVNAEMARRIRQAYGWGMWACNGR